jgi:uncharacterized membrane protein (UPF0182 family)
VKFPPLPRGNLQSVNRFARRVSVALLTAVVVIALVGSASEKLSERWWANTVGFAGSYDLRLKVSGGLWLAALSLSALALIVTVRRVERVARGVIADHHPVDPAIRWPLIIAGTLMVAPILGARWMAVMLAWNGWSQPMPGPPVLGPDPGFYMFRLPLLQALTAWFTAVSAVSFVVTVALLMLTGLISRRDGRLQGANPGVARLLALPVVCFCLGMAAAMWWSRFGLASRSNGRFVGLFSVDYSMRVPALSLLGLGAVAIGVTALLTVRRRVGAIGVLRSMTPIDLWDEFVLLRIGVVLWLVTALMTLAVLPGVVQTQPLTATAQQNNMARHIEATVVGYDLGDVDVTPVAVKNSPSMAAVRAHAVELQQSGLLAVVGAVATQADEWLIGARTPSRGAVVTSDYATSTNKDGSIRGLSLRSRWGRVVLAVRFGSATLLNTSGGRDTFVHHREVRERARAIAPFLWFDSEPYMLNDDRGRSLWVLDAYTGSKRFPGAQRFSPDEAGLTRDADIGYGVNFVRASAKVVVDARTGEMRFYRTNENDPIGDVWAKSFPGMFRSGKAIDTDYPGIGKQLRYPHDLLRLQALVLANYHSRDNQKLVTESDRWAPVEMSASEGLGQTSIYQQYVLTSDRVGRLSAIRLLEQRSTDQTATGKPSGVAGKVTAILVGRSDANGRGRLTVDRVNGPVAGLTRQNVAASSAVEMARRIAKVEKASLEFGPLQPLTVGSALVFVQTVYAATTSKDRPRAVVGIVATEGNQIVVARSADAAITELVDVLARPVTTVAPSSSLKALQRSLDESQKRLTESERVISSLQERIAKLESAGDQIGGTSKQTVTTSTSTSLVP